jgi:serine/threonine protein kinase/WD40 repeat protein/tetratricopeptide (TPR) repeat protein
MDLSSSGRCNLLDQLVEEFAERYRRGERPSLQEYLERYPALADDIRDLFPALAVVEQAEADRPRPPEAKVPPPPLQQVGDYRILRPIGAGGMGVVYEAVQVSLGRHVALKVLSPQVLGDGRARERFHREARAAARLHHTNIVPVFEVGQEGEVCFYAMQLIEGQGLDQVIVELRRLRALAGTPPPGEATGVATTLARTADAPRSGALSAVAQSLLSGHFEPAPAPSHPVAEPAPAATSAAGNGRSSLSGIETGPGPYYRSVARIGQQAALALAHAHTRGIVHRDVKPSNLLLDESGVVWVADFGLAKTEDDNLTRTGELPGTLRYMSPERFEGHCDGRADVYALGLTLYEMLVLTPAFPASDRLALLEQIRTRQPPRPRALDPRVPRDLETVVLKAIDKDPRRRYPSADDLAEDLRRFLADEPIRARQARLPERLGRWCRHNPAVAALTLALLLGTAVATFFAFRANANAVRALDAERGRREQLLEALLAEARAKRYSGRVGQRFGTLEAVRKATALAQELDKPPEVFDELRSLAVAALALPDFRVAAKTWDGWPEGSFGLAFDPVALRLYARGDQQGNISVRRLQDDEEVARLAGEGNPREIVFGVDGETLLLHDTKSGALERWAIGGPAPEKVATVANDVCLWQQSRDGGRLLALHQSAEGTRAEVIDLPSGCRRFEHRSPTHESTLTRWRAALSPDGRWLALADGLYLSPQRNRLLLFNLDTGKLAGELPQTQAFAPAWHPDNRTLAVADWNGEGISLWDAPAGKRLRTLNDLLDGEPYLALSPSGQLLSGAGTRGSSQVFWHPHTGKTVLRTPFNYTVTRTVQDGRQFQVDIGKSQLTLHVVEPSPVFRTLVPGGRFFDVSLHPGGRLLAIAHDHGVSLLDLPTGLEIGRLPSTYSSALRFAPSTGDLLTLGQRGLFRWPVRVTPGSPETVEVGPPLMLDGGGSMFFFDASRDGKVIAIPNYTQVVVYRQEVPRPRAVTLGPLTDTREVRLSPDGRWALTWTHATTKVVVWDTQTGRQVAQLPGAPTLFTPDGRWLTDGRRRLEAGTWKEGPAVPIADGPKVHAFAPGGALFVGQSNAEVVDLVETATGKTLVQLGLPEQSRMGSGFFSADGSELIQYSANYGYLYAWDLRALRRHLADLGLDWKAPPYPPAPAVGRRLPPVLTALRPNNPEVGLAHCEEDPELLLLRAQLHACCGQWAEAADDFTKRTTLEAPPPGNPAHLPYQRALALLRAGKSEDYRKACADMIERFKDTRDWETACVVAWTCVLRPDAVADWAPVLRLAERARGKTPGHPRSHHVMGAVLYRMGRPEESLPRFRAAEEVVPSQDPTLPASVAFFHTASPAYVHFFLAMTHHQLGNREEARRWLDRAAAQTDKEFSDGWEINKADRWYRKATLQLLRAEAEAVIRGAAPKAEK